MHTCWLKALVIMENNLSTDFILHHGDETVNHLILQKCHDINDMCILGLQSLVLKLDVRLERKDSLVPKRIGFMRYKRQPGLPCQSPPPVGAPKWTIRNTSST